MLYISWVMFLSRLTMLNLIKTSSLVLVSFWSLSPQPSVSTPSPFCWCPCNSPLHVRDTEYGDERRMNKVTQVMSLRGVTKDLFLHGPPQLSSGLTVNIVVKWWRRDCAEERDCIRPQLRINSCLMSVAKDPSYQISVTWFQCYLSRRFSTEFC